MEGFKAHAAPGAGIPRLRHLAGLMYGARAVWPRNLIKCCALNRPLGQRGKSRNAGYEVMSGLMAYQRTRRHPPSPLQWQHLPGKLGKFPGKSHRRFPDGKCNPPTISRWEMQPTDDFQPGNFPVGFSISRLPGGSFPTCPRAENFGCELLPPTCQHCTMSPTRCGCKWVPVWQSISD